MMAQNFQNIQVWQEAVKFHTALISILPQFPKEEIYAMTSQLRRASLSISNNIAEGCGRETPKEFKNFLNIAMGSVKEVENMIIVAEKLNYINSETFKTLINRIITIGKKLNSFIQAIMKNIPKKNNISYKVGRSPKTNNQKLKTKNAPEVLSHE